MHRIIVIILITLFFSCSTTLTREGMFVRQISPSIAIDCKFLGVVQGSEDLSWDSAGHNVSAMNQIRNEVARKGGNAYVLTLSGGDIMRTVVQADAYNCTFKK